MHHDRSASHPGSSLVRQASRRTVSVVFAAMIVAFGIERGLGPQASARPRRHRRRSRAQAASQPPAPLACDPGAASGIAGTVLIGPMCPVVTVDDPCPDRPFAATLGIRDSQGQELCATTSGEDGRFRFGLPPGLYDIVPVNGIADLPYASPQPVTVEPGRYTDVLVSYDSGIR